MTNKELLYFVVGAAVGSVVTWFVIKDKYEQKYQEEVTSVKEALKVEKRDATVNEVKKTVEEEVKHALNEKPDIMQYAAKLRDLRYQTNKEEVKTSSVHVISPDDFGEEDEYERISLTYYQGDGVLADDLGEIVDEEIIGDALSHFGEYEDDSVFCRDDVKKADYEILLDQRSYSEIAHPEMEG